MDFTFLEKMAVRETGRAAVRTYGRHRKIRLSGRANSGRLIVYPTQLRYADLLPKPDADDFSATLYLSFGPGSIKRIGLLWQLICFIAAIFVGIGGCRQIDVFLMSRGCDRPYALIAAAIGRLFGRSVIIHDYRFSESGNRQKRPLIHSICSRIEAGDSTACCEKKESDRIVTYRIDLTDLSCYRKLRKGRAVPRVIVYGDFEDNKIISLTNRSHELIKKKYPRTEFVLVSSTSQTDMTISKGLWDRSIVIAELKTEDDMISLYEEADILMLLSRGGLNRCFIRRAAAAGFPIITNDMEIFGEHSEISTAISVTRDSYSALAEAVIRLVDDESYYCSFAD